MMVVLVSSPTRWKKSKADSFRGSKWPGLKKNSTQFQGCHALFRLLTYHEQLQLASVHPEPILVLEDLAAVAHRGQVIAGGLPEKSENEVDPRKMRIFLPRENAAAGRRRVAPHGRHARARARGPLEVVQPEHLLVVGGGGGGAAAAAGAGHPPVATENCQPLRQF